MKITRPAALAGALLLTLSLAACGNRDAGCAKPTPRATVTTSAYIAGPPPAVRMPAPAPRPVIPKAPAPKPAAPKPAAPKVPTQKAPPRNTQPGQTSPRDTTPSRQNHNPGVWPFYLWGTQNDGCRS